MKYFRFVFVFALAITLTACGGLGGNQQPQQPSLAELQATAMAQAQANLALTQAAIPTDTPPLPTPTDIVLPTLPPMTLPPLVSSTPTFASGGSGGASSNEATSLAQGCDQVSYNPSTVDATIPDGTVMDVGQAFTKEWLIYNSGTCTWTSSYSFVFANGDQMGAPGSIPLTASVAPGHSLEISIPMIADSSPIPATDGNWRMQNDSGNQFGTYFTVDINVVNPNTATPVSITETQTNVVIGATITPTPTVAPSTSTPTTAPTPTP